MCVGGGEGVVGVEGGRGWCVGGGASVVGVEGGQWLVCVGGGAGVVGFEGMGGEGWCV